LVQLLDLEVESKPLPSKKQRTVLEEYYRSTASGKN